MTLKEKIKDNHDKAETHPFVKVLFSGNINHELYLDFLHNQFYCYDELEKQLVKHGLHIGIEEVLRASKIQFDYATLSKSTLGSTICNKYPSTIKYCEYVKGISKKDLLAHLYVRHFGDMYGGQMLKSKVPGSASMYEFENRSTLISKIREMLSDDLADEANLVFSFVSNLFDELSNEHSIPEA